MVILQRGIPAHIQEKNLRKSTPVSMSNAERERYAIAAQSRGMSLSAFLRFVADEYLGAVRSAPAVLSGTEYAEQLNALAQAGMGEDGGEE